MPKKWRVSLDKNYFWFVKNAAGYHPWPIKQFIADRASLYAIWTSIYCVWLLPNTSCQRKPWTTFGWMKRESNFEPRRQAGVIKILQAHLCIDPKLWTFQRDRLSDSVDPSAVAGNQVAEILKHKTDQLHDPLLQDLFFPKKMRGLRFNNVGLVWARLGKPRFL